MHFLRFGSSIPGAYMTGGGGCCAAEIIQGFNQDPDTPASIEVVNGDGGYPCNGYFLGKTYQEIFEARLRIGTFSDDDLPNHAFLCILTQSQLYGETGKKWLKILKENGFEFIRSFDNSVYSGDTLASNVSTCDDPEWCEGYLETDSNPNYLFGLFRNIGNGKMSNPFQPPREWTELKGGTAEATAHLSLETQDTLREFQEEFHEKRWNEIGPVTFYTREQLEAEGIPIWLAGVRSQFPQERAEQRAAKQASTEQPKAAPF
jgi:hypothetical protein